MLDYLKNGVLIIALVFLAIVLVFSFMRSLIGPRIADRIVAINMIGTQIIMIICIISVYLNEAGLIDIAIIYAMFSFLAVVFFTRLYIGSYVGKHIQVKKEEQKND
ncbi:MAG: monovalent cation/H+ antiporter complex subunit F [Cellulosilyticum sp.]|nr:monovalent cation/H+ antiporter complex subunit F [Cellulosilyticum sp.]